MRISDWSSDVCSSDLPAAIIGAHVGGQSLGDGVQATRRLPAQHPDFEGNTIFISHHHSELALRRSEEHTSELQSLMRISYAVFCLIKKKKTTNAYSIHIKQEQIKSTVLHVQYISLQHTYIM